MSFDNLIGYIMSISMFMQHFIIIFFSIQEIGPFFLFQNLALGKASTDDKCHFAIPWARSFQHQIVCKILSKYSKRFKSYDSLFSEFEPRQNLDQSQMSFDNLMGYILLIPMCTQNSITIFHSVQEIGSFSLFQYLELGKTSTDEKWHFTISWSRSCQYQCLCRSLSKYSTQFKR